MNEHMREGGREGVLISFSDSPGRDKGKRVGNPNLHFPFTKEKKTIRPKQCSRLRDVAFKTLLRNWPKGMQIILSRAVKQELKQIWRNDIPPFSNLCSMFFHHLKQVSHVFNPLLLTPICTYICGSVHGTCNLDKLAGHEWKWYFPPSRPSEVTTRFEFDFWGWSRRRWRERSEL